MHLFQYLRRSRAGRISASLLILLFLSDVLYPTAAWALTSGPTQPEFTSFEPVVTTNMVNEFTGDFTYNLPILQIPGPNGGGYAMSLSYHSGASPEDEASWVGYGWTLNPGAINRQRQGIPDDWDGEQMTFYNQTVPNTTVTAGVSAAGELFSTDLPASADFNIHYNNYTGFGYGIGAGLTFCGGMVSLGFHVNDGQGSFSLTVNPAAMLDQKVKEAKYDLDQASKELKQYPTCDEAKSDYAGKLQKYKDAAGKDNRQGRALKTAGNMTSAYGMRALAAQNYPMAAQEMDGVSYKLGMGLNVCVPPTEIGFSGNVFGQYTKQTSAPEKHRDAYGYLHSGSQMASGAIMDYHSENQSPYNKRDQFLPLAVNDADQFIATGEGIMGGMRFYDRQNTPFRPEESRSKTDIVQLGAEINAGLYVGGGVDISAGYQELVANGADHSESDPDALLRMNGDLGGSVGYYTSSLPENAHVDPQGAYGFRHAEFDMPNDLVNPVLDQGKRPQASSAVGFHTEDEMFHYGYRDYEKTPLYKMTDGSSASHTSGSQNLAEISVLNEQGQRYNYGLPVQASNDVSLAFNHVNDNNDHHWSNYNGSVSNTSVKIGSSSTAKYATSFLLTSITDPDFVDRSHDGPTPDDIGGYTRFIYKRHTHGGSSDANGYFNWRTPYEGYAYSDPELSECSDNRISYSAGEKEVYYLDKVMTRSHVAIFHRSPRADGLGANLTNGQGGGQAPDQTLDKLDSINLYMVADSTANGDYTHPIKTVHFAYAAHAAEAWPNIPNTTAPGGGKLTLSRVWFDSNGVVPVRISPYEFEYHYPNVDYAQQVSSIHIPNMAIPTPPNQIPLNEAPSYSNWITDPWGNYRDDGHNASLTGRYESPFRPWLNQGINPISTPAFDPAAWQLKVIKLPSGGQIHIQYEEDTYAYVENEKACALLPLWVNGSDSPITSDGSSTTFKVDVRSLRGLSTDLLDTHAFHASDIAREIKQIYHDGDRKIYFKFLYGFNNQYDPVGRNGEFITGYCNIIEDNDHPIQGNDTEGSVTFTISSGDHSKPLNVCRDLYNAQKRGKDLSAGCDAGVSTDHYTDGSSSVRASIEHLGNDLSSFVASIVSSPCGKIDRSQCYFRIPVGAEKRGGGIRVKRLLMSDPQAAAEGYPGVLGSEYQYSTLDQGKEISSGVATNEPGGSREENPLVRPLDRLSQSWTDRVIAGRDRKQMEGPEGESLYPSPSVGYSRVIVRNIDQGPTAPAFVVKDFFTSKDYPVRVEHTDIDAPAPDYVVIMTGIVNILRDNVWASQGYTVHLNQMNGKPKCESEYTGDPNALLGDQDVNAARSSSTEYDYFGPEDNIPILVDAQGTIGSAPLGRSCDLTIENRSVKDDTEDGSVELDIGVGLVGFAPIPMAFAHPSVGQTHSSMATHVITKVIEHPALLRCTKVFKDGIWHISENAAFDRNTGEPVVVRTHDGFYTGDLAQITGTNGLAEGPGTYTSVTIPASMEYPSMGQAAKGEGMVITSVCGTNTPGVCLNLTPPSPTFTKVSIVPVNGVDEGSICDLTSAMCTGDLMELRTATQFGYYHLDHVNEGDLYLTKSKDMGSGDLAFTTSQTLKRLLIVRSGCTNQLKEQAGMYTYYGARSASTPQTGQQVQFVAYINDQLNHLLHPGDPVTVVFPAGIDLSGIGPYTGPPTVSLLNGNTGRFEFLTTKCDVPVNTQVRIDPASGLIVYGNGDCLDKPFCEQFAKPYFPPTTIDNVVACAASHYSDNWPNEAQRDLLADWDNTSMAGADAFDKAERGKWRASSHFTYNTSLTQGSTNKDQGMYPMVLHNWAYPPSNDAFTWVRTDSVIAYSPDGNVLEERDALGHPSCAKFGYDHTLPYLVAKNSIGGSSLFDSFEKDYTRNGITFLEDGVALTGWQDQALVLDDQVAHAGHRSLRGGGFGLLFKASKIQTPSAPMKLEVKAWIRALDGTGKCRDITPTAHLLYPAQGPTASIDQAMSAIARTGEWVLYSATIQVPTGITSVNVTISEATQHFTTWIDDVRIQPAEAQMTCYVYDPKNFRLLATFDDQHFGLYYQYNDEGKLVRKLIETEHGIRTVQETQYNSPTVAR